MGFARFLFGAAAGCVVLAAGAAGLAGGERQTVFGNLQTTVEDGTERGRYRLSWTERDNGRVIDRVEVACRGLDATADEAGDLPTYDLWLTSHDGDTSVDFGDLILTRRGSAGFVLDTRRDTLPDGVTSVADFGGGVIEVRRGTDVVLEAAIPSFRGPGDSNSSGSGAVGVRQDRSVLTSSSGSRARVTLEARYANRPDEVREWIRVVAVNLQRNGAPYTVVAIDGDGNDIALFQLTPRGRSGAANDTVDTLDGDAIPGGNGLTALSELSVEVRDDDGNVVLTGSFPDITID